MSGPPRPDHEKGFQASGRRIVALGHLSGARRVTWALVRQILRVTLEDSRLLTSSHAGTVRASGLSAMRLQESPEVHEAAIAIIERPLLAAAALRALPADSEQTHVLAKCGDERGSAFARRVLRRVRQVRHSGLKIRKLSYSVSSERDVANARHRGRLLATLVRSLEPGATFTLIACGLSAAEALGWTNSLLTLAHVGVSLEVVL